MLRIEENVAIKLPKISQAGLDRVTEALLPAGGSAALEVKIAAIHEGLTRNNTNYFQEGLTHKVKNDQGQVGGLASWTQPYGAPILRDHQSEADNILGRVTNATWIPKEGSTPGHVELTARITNPEAIEKFIRGEYETGSIGMDVDSAKCSICESDFMKGWASACEHERGKWYAKAPKGTENEGSWMEAEPHAKGARRMHINIGNVWAREYSVVATPSDAKSKVKSFELKEMLLTEAEQPIYDFIKEAAITESETTKTEEPIVTENVRERSVAELMPFFYDLISEDVLSTYFACAAHLAAHEAEFALDAKFTAVEYRKIMTEIESTHEELEAELKALSDIVLSTESDKLRPDSSFAIIKTLEGKKLRALPYKTAEGSVVDTEELLLSLSRVGTIPTFTPAERAKATLRLLAAARKAKVATPQTPEDRIAAAKEFVEDLAYTVVSAEELAALTPANDFKTRLTQAEEALAQAQTIISERELESDELLESIADLKDQLVIVEAGAKALIVESIISLESVEETDRTAKVAELSALETSELSTKLTELSTERILVTARVERLGLAGGETDIEVGIPKIPTATIMAAHFGSKRNANRLAEALRKR